MEHEQNDEPQDEYGLPPEDGIEDFEDSIHAVEGDGYPSTDEDDEDELEEEEEEEEEEEPVVLEFEEEPYPDPAKEPWDLERVEKHFYNMALMDILKSNGVDTADKQAVSKALNHAYRETPVEMRELEEQLKKDARKATLDYKKKEYDPWYEQYENARIAEEFQEVLDVLPEVGSWMEEIQLVGPSFFEKYPHLADSPAKALPILLNIVQKLGRVDKAPKKPSFQMETGRRQTRAPKQREESGLFKKGIRDPGEWAASL